MDTDQSTDQEAGTAAGKPVRGELTKNGDIASSTTSQQVMQVISRPQQDIVAKHRSTNTDNSVSERCFREKTKIIVRRLPPTMSEAEFLDHVAPLAKHDYFCFMEADRSLGQYAYSRVYINFKHAQDAVIFCERFDNYIFYDANGHEYAAVVEHAPWQKVPTRGLFARNATNTKTTTTTGMPISNDSLS